MNATYREPGRTCGEYLSPQTTISLADEVSYSICIMQTACPSDAAVLCCPTYCLIFIISAIVIVRSPCLRTDFQLGIIPAEHKDAVIDTLVADVAAHDWHLNVGIVGIKCEWILCY